MTIESGRAAFAKFAWAIGILCRIVACLPFGLRTWLWDMSRPFGGRLALVLRYAILKYEAASIGEVVYVGRNVTLRNAGSLVIGSNVSIHENSYIDAIGGCRIGDNVSIAHASSILTFDHVWDDPGTPVKYNSIVKSPVVIGDDVWIGAGVRILRGITVGSRCIIAAGAVVRSDLSACAVYGGVPAKKLRDI